MTTYIPIEERQLVLKASSVHARLGDNFYYIFRILPCHLEKNLLLIFLDEREGAAVLSRMGFEQDRDFGVTVTHFLGRRLHGAPTTGYSACKGLVFAEEGWRSDDNWSASLVSCQAREQYYAREDLIKRAKAESRKADIESKFQAAVLERIPEHVVTWARKQQDPASEIGLVRGFVTTLRMRQVGESVIQEALAHPSFSQELIRLTRSTEAK